MTAETWLRRGSRVGLVVAAVGLARSAAAQATPADDAPLQRGIQLRKESRDAEALEEFKRSYAQHPTSRARAQIALALQAIGRWLDAETELGAALADRDDPWIARNRDALERARGTIAQHLGTFEGTSDAPATEIFVNGVRVPPGQPLRVVAGSLVVEARATGYAPVRRAVDVPPSGVARESFAMTKVAPMATEGGAGPVAVAAPAQERRIFDVAAPVAPRESSARLTWGWISLAAGGASLAAGVVATIVRENNAQIYNDESRCPAAERSRACASQRDTVSVATGAAIGGYVGAGVLLTTGAVLLLGAPRRSASPAPVLSAWLAPTHGVVSFQQAF